jgi:hypothetical protein
LALKNYPKKVRNDCCVLISDQERDLEHQIDEDGVIRKKKKQQFIEGGMPAR